MPYNYTITEQYHEKKERNIYVLRLIDKVDKDEFSILRNKAKNHGGYYSSYRGVNGFVFQTEDDAEAFAGILNSYNGALKNTQITEEVEESIVAISEPSQEKKKKRARTQPIYVEEDIVQDSIKMVSGMPLHIALKHIIQTEGDSIIIEARLVRILDDLHAYDSVPASKYILRAIIEEGYSSNLITIGKWDKETVALSSRFASLTGFIPETVSIIFQSLAYGLGWLNALSLPISSNFVSQNSETIAQVASSNMASPTPVKWSKKWMKIRQRISSCPLLNMMIRERRSFMFQCRI